MAPASAFTTSALVAFTLRRERRKCFASTSLSQHRGAVTPRPRHPWRGVRLSDADWPLTREQLAAAHAERRGNTLALLEGRAAGFANFYQSEPGDYCALGNLMIAPWARGRGVASYLVGAMERQALDDFDARELRVACFCDNTAGLLLYASLGYQPCGLVERRRGERRVALLQLVKRLRS